MSLIIIKIVGSMLVAISGFYAVRNLLDSKEKILKTSNIIPLTLIMIPICFLYEEKYSLLLVMFLYLAEILSFKRIYKLNIETSILASSIFMLLTAFIDIIGTSIELSKYQKLSGTVFLSSLK